MIDHVVSVPQGRAAELPAWMKELCSTVTTSMSGGKLKEIIDAQVRKAESGSTTAAVFCLELYTQSQKALAIDPPIPTRATQVSGSDTLPPTRETLRRRIVEQLRQDSPLKPGELAARIGSEEGTVREILKHSDSFRRVPTNYECYAINPELVAGPVRKSLEEAAGK